MATTTHTDPILAAAWTYESARQDYVNDHPYPREAADDAWLIEQAGDVLGDLVVKMIAAFGGESSDYLWPVCDAVENGDFLKACAELRMARRPDLKAAA